MRRSGAEDEEEEKRLRHLHLSLRRFENTSRGGYEDAFSLEISER